MRKISTFVILAHVILLIWMALVAVQMKEPKKTRLVVRSVSPQPKTIQAHVPPVMPNVTQSLPVRSQPQPVKLKPPIATPPPQQSTKPIPQKPKKEIPVSAPNKPTPMPSATLEILKKLDQSLAKMEQPVSVQNPPMIKRNSKLAEPILKIDHSDGEEAVDAGYETELIGFLHERLHLPEFGEVKMKLTLQNNGTCVNIQVIRAQSAKNRRYLEENLPILRLPPFMGALAGKKGQTFIMTFCNE